MQGGSAGQHKSWLRRDHGKRQKVLNPDLPEPLHVDDSDLSDYDALTAHGIATASCSAADVSSPPNCMRGGYKGEVQGKKKQV